MHSNSFPEYIPGVYVINESRFDWGLGQIQSSINNKITINFENVGKKVINPNIIKLKIININATT
tara:strand:+ start:304 stop:498 length:195 start_codon:yes stop_codon:yes gene_type:complete